jgi:hypothetical protein
MYLLFTSTSHERKIGRDKVVDPRIILMAKITMLLFDFTEKILY